jgi:predicted Rossmann fold nucleotide-binding protein DprA/Smf involved in DNA uptake
MKQLKKDLQAVSKTLKQLTLRTENIAKRLNKLEKPKPVKKAKAKAKAKPKVTKKLVQVSAAATVLAIIKRSRKGVDVATLKSKAGFEGRTVNNIIYKLKKKGKIKCSGRGIYVKA